MLQLTNCSVFTEFSDALLKQEELILRTWLERSTADASVRTGQNLKRSAFYDHIPQILDLTARKLAQMTTADPMPSIDPSLFEKHGRERWRQGFGLAEVIADWRNLQSVLLDVFAVYATGRNDTDCTLKVSTFISSVITLGIEWSVQQYESLSTTEARLRERDLEEALASMNDRILKQRERLAETAHDLEGGTDMLLSLASSFGKGADTHTREFVEVLASCLSYNRELLKDLAVLAKLEAHGDAPKCEDFDAADLIRKLCREAEHCRLDEPTKILCEGPEHLVVHLDMVKVARIANNLLSNALKYSQGSNVRVKWGLLNDEQWELKVIDSGPGIQSRAGQDLSKALLNTSLTPSAAVKANKIDTFTDKEGNSTQGRVDDVVTQLSFPCVADGTRSGHGIGLSIVKRLCEVLDARFELYTAEGQGVAVFIRFPVRL